MTQMQQPVTGFVETNGTRLYYEMIGEGHPLVLIHGGYTDRRMWDDQFAEFAQQYRVIRYDVRGFGETGLPPVPYTDRQDLFNLLAFLGVDTTYIVALSLGGEIAIDFTLDYPDRVVEGVMSHPTLVPCANYASARQKVRENLSEYSFVWVLEPGQKQATVPAAWGRLGDISAPTLITVGGDDDKLLHTIADKLERDIPDAQRVTISETHHMPNMEKPAEFNRIELDFLKIVGKRKRV